MTGNRAAPTAPDSARRTAPLADAELAGTSVRSVAGPDEIAELRVGDLSDWFNPFLAHFMAESLRCGGEVLVAEAHDAIVGVYLYSPAERIASVFTRSPALAEALFRARRPLSMYSPFPLGPEPEPYLIYARMGDGTVPTERFRHPVRLASRNDLVRVVPLLREVYGEVDEQWIASMPDAVERCFVVELSGELAGAAWASRVGDVGRLHSLSVRPRYRRLGIGTDLFRARCLWLGAAGATSILSEIAERNSTSRRITEAGGMKVVGRIFRLERGSEPKP